MIFLDYKMANLICTSTSNTNNFLNFDNSISATIDCLESRLKYSTNTRVCTYAKPTELCLNRTDDAIVILHVNIRSLIKNMDKLLELLTELKDVPDVIAISETKLNEYNEKLVNIPNFNFVCSNSLTKAGELVSTYVII